MTRARSRVVGVALALAAACGLPAPPPPRPLVVASFYPLWEFTRQVAGDRAEVVSLVPPGVEPHDWEPSPADVARLQKARVFIYQGAGFDPWAENLLQDLGARGGIVVRATDGIALVGGGTREGPDPHVWLDPILARKQVETIREALARSDPAGATAYAESATAFTARLMALHDAYTRGLRDCGRRDLIASHASLGYLVRRYGLTVTPIMGLAPEAEPGPAALAALARLARARRVQYVLVEPLVSPKLGETLAREVGARTLVFDPLEGPTAEGTTAGQGYLTIMEANLNVLRTALGCR